MAKKTQNKQTKSTDTPVPAGSSSTDFFEKNKGLVIAGTLIAIIVVVALMLIGFFAAKYNMFVGLDQQVTKDWSEVENQYQRQADLIPNLVSVTSSSVKMETKFVTDITEARSRWATAKAGSSTIDKDLAGVQMNNAINAFVQAVSTNENYPVLQANKQYTALFDEVSGTQNRITVARGRYIESVQAYNTAVRRFPNNFVANIFGFMPKEYYKAAQDAMQSPKLGDGQLPQ